MATLYDLSEAVRSVLDGSFAVDAETGEIFDSESLDVLDGLVDDKLEACCKYMRELGAEAEAIKAEEQRLAQRRRAAEARAQRFRGYVLGCMERAGKQKIKTPLFSMWIGHSHNLEVTDADALPEQFVSIRSERVIDKRAIKDAIKAGAEIPGARLVESTSLQVR